MLATLTGVDHAVVTVRDLDAAADHWRRLGFTLSPRGEHSAHLGTGNYTMMLQDDYLELVGVLIDTELNAPSRAFLARRGEGMERVAFTTTDARAGAAALRARGLEPIGPVDFSRPVTLPDGGTATASFSVFHWPIAQRPADTRLFACQHHTRDAVWVPSLQSHANTAQSIRRIEILAIDPLAAATSLADAIATAAVPLAAQSGRGFTVASAHGRAVFMVVDHDSFLERHPQARRDELPPEGVGAIIIGVMDIDRAQQAVTIESMRLAHSIEIAPRFANGVRVVLESV